MRLRPTAAGDLEAVYAVLTARELGDFGAAEYLLADLEERWRQPGFDLGADARVVEDGAGGLVGYGEVCHDGSLVAVAPDAEGQGIGAMLLEFVESRAPALGHTAHRQQIASANRSGAELLSRAGYQLVRSNIRMRLLLPVGVGVGAVATTASEPGTLQLRPLDIERDAATVHALDDAAFTGVAGYQPWGLQEFVAEHLRAHDLDAGLSRVAEAAGRMIGFALVRRRVTQAMGYVDVLGVHPEFQGAGVGGAILGAVIAGCGAAGLEAVGLTVASDNSRARRLYDRTGFAPVRRCDIYEKPI